MRGCAAVGPSSSSLTTFKPRQILLFEHRQKNQAVSTSMAKNKPEKAAQLKPEDESILTCSIALWLENKGFSKVLKRFLSAARIQDDDWKAKALNLNEVFSKYQESCTSAHEGLKSQKNQEEQVVDTTENGDANVTSSEEIQNKKKKTKSKREFAVKENGRTLEGLAVREKTNKSYVNGNGDQSHGISVLSHKDQKTKSAKESNGNEFPELSKDQSSKKLKEEKKKKKKKNKMASQSLDPEEKQIDEMPDATELNHKGSLSKSSSETAEDGGNESKKASKKRKRMAPDENELQCGQEVAIEESKSKKSKGQKEDRDDLQQTAVNGAHGHTGEQHNVEAFEAGTGSKKVSAKQSDESSKNAISNNGMDQSSPQKSASGQPKSSEAKTLKAFQRVNVDEVEFVDERLQDNSYWAKDGAEIGYGAKAQEVLGQVKGRDFRHEKTKKKRGSYRGGQIDLQSHSIKFNYSDDE